MEGKDAEGLPFAFLKSVGCKVGGQAMGKVNYGEKVPFQCLVPDNAGRVVVTLDFHAHYGEPSLDIPLSITPGSGGWGLHLSSHTLNYMFAYTDTEVVASLEYNPFTREWKVQRSDEDEAQLAAKLQSAKV